MTESLEISIRLQRSIDDARTYEEDYQVELRQFEVAVDSLGIAVRPRSAVFDNLGTTGGLTGEFIVSITQAITPLLTAAVVAWVGRKNGRKLRLKIGDIEYEGNTQEDIKLLFAQAKELAPVVDPDNRRKDRENDN